MRPQVWIVAGPNGSGKTTFTRRHLSGKLPIVNPDEIARELSPVRPEAPEVALRAGREAIARRQELMAAKESFAIETTFSGNSELAFVRSAKAAGYKINLVFVATASPLVSTGRIALRVQDGGHFVPRSDVDRRYHRSLANLPEGVALADRAWLIDNSGKRPWLVATIERVQEKASSMNLPRWAKHAIPSLGQDIGLGF